MNAATLHADSFWCWAVAGLSVCLLQACVGGAGGGDSRGKVVLPPVDRAPDVTLTEVQRLERLPDPKVVAEPKSRGGNREVYTVFGKSYRVMDDARGYKQTGIASWYGTKFHGRPTANGERFDIYQLTAAHKHLPLPSFVRVTNLENGRQTIVRVNDRGPFHDNRIIDLSYAAAVKLGFHNKGTARVRMEVLHPDQRHYLLQAGAYSTLAGADRSQAQLRALTGLAGAVVKTGQDELYRVHLGPIRDRQEVERLTALLTQSQFGKPKLIEVRCAPNC